jgi:thiopurine S-methyltransferase
MIWLGAQGHAVVGIELSREAVQAFAAEHGGIERVDLRCGDLFALEAAQLGPIQGVFDRGALVALPPAMRQRYAAQLTALSPPGTRTLLVTMEYDQSKMKGPPHSVPEAEVHALYGAQHDIELLQRDTQIDDGPKFAQRGLESIAEAYYLLTRR